MKYEISQKMLGSDESLITNGEIIQSKNNALRTIAVFNIILLSFKSLNVNQTMSLPRCLLLYNYYLNQTGLLHLIVF